MASLYAFAALRLARREPAGGGSALRAVGGLNDRLVGLLALPLLPAILSEGIETAAPWFTLLLTAGAVLAVLVAVYRWPGAARRAPGAKPDRLPLFVLVGMMLGYAWLASTNAINHHRSLGTSTFDLAIYDNIFWQTLHGRPLGCSLTSLGTHLTAHVDPILVLLSPLYWLYPRAELLLVLQSIWLASSVLPLFFLGRRLLGSAWQALALAFALLLQPAMHGANFFDFHSLSLVAPLFLWAFYFAETRSRRGFAVALALMLLTREDMALLACFLGLYLIVGRGERRLGLITLAVSLSYFVVISVLVAVFAGAAANTYTHYYGDLAPEGSGGLPLLETVLANPLFTLRHLFAPDKLFYLALLFLPLLFLPLFARRGKLLMVYGLAVILAASRPALYSVHFQYSSLVYPVLFALLPLGLVAMTERRQDLTGRLDDARFRRALLGGILAASILVTVKFGGLWPNDSFRAGFVRFQTRMSEPTRATYAWVEATAASIPPEASVSVSQHMGPHVSNRRRVYRFPRYWGADYLFIRRSDLRAWEEENLEMLEGSGSYRPVAQWEERILLFQRDDRVALPARAPRD
jgi:uncharacterized membrane protein